VINANKILVRKPEGKPLEDPEVDGSKLKLILCKYVGKMWTGYIWLRTGISGGLLGT
jgi:hypothetical protein